MKKYKKYLVNAYEDTTWKKVFKARNKEEAERKALKEIGESGWDSWNTGNNCECDIFDVEEIKE